jgi:hypothetical protein
MPEQTQDSAANPSNLPRTTAAGTGPGSAEAGVGWIIAIIAYLVLFTVFVGYAMVKIWPVRTPSRENPPAAQQSPSSTATAPATAPAAGATTPTASPAGQSTPVATGQNSTAPAARSTASPTPTPSPSPGAEPSPVTFLGYQFSLWDEQRLLFLVLLGGALGTLVHCLRSIYWYIGNRSLVKSWMAMYFMMPFAGSSLALVFYLLIRGGFFSPQSSFQETSPFGFAAFAALIGMFSTQAVLKLKDVAEVLLSKPQGGANPQPQQSLPGTGAAPTPPPAPAIPPPPPAPESATTPPAVG